MAGGNQEYHQLSSTQMHLLAKRGLRWIGHVRRMKDSCILNDMFGKIRKEKPPIGLTLFSLKVLVKGDLEKNID